MRKTQERLVRYYLWLTIELLYVRVGTKEYVLVIERTAPAASSKDVSHTTSPPEVESSVEIGTNSPVPVRFLFWCNLQSYIFFGSKALWDKKKKNTRAHLCLLGPSKEYILVD